MSFLRFLALSHCAILFHFFFNRNSFASIFTYFSIFLPLTRCRQLSFNVCVQFDFHQLLYLNHATSFPPPTNPFHSWWSYQQGNFLLRFQVWMKINSGSLSLLCYSRNEQTIEIKIDGSHFVHKYFVFVDQSEWFRRKDLVNNGNINDPVRASKISKRSFNSAGYRPRVSMASTLPQIP